MTRSLSKSLRVTIVALCLSALTAAGASARSAMDSTGNRSANAASMAFPAYCLAAHNIGRIGFTVSNWGQFGTGSDLPWTDCVTGDRVPDAEYPLGSGTLYLFKGGVWVGGVVGGDTLVSTATDRFSSSREFAPDASPWGDIVRRTRVFDPLNTEPSDAISEQDFIATFTDTYVLNNPYPSFDGYDGREHKPLGIEVTQSSYMWSFGYADDFIIIEYNIRNIGTQLLKGVFFGFHMDPDIAVYSPTFSPIISDRPSKPIEGGDDDITGYLHSYPNEQGGCLWEDTVRMTWAIDADGDYNSGNFTVGNVTGIRLLRDLVSNEYVTYNWYIQDSYASDDFGPQMKQNLRKLISGGLGSPTGDRERYFLMSNGEIDYDQIFQFDIASTDPDWIYMSNRRKAFEISQGADINYVFAVGPQYLPPGASYTIPFAFVGGESFHTYSRNVTWNLRNAYRPARYLTFLDFPEFVRNATWASWVYDNPGVDTDGDGYAGKYTVCVYDSSFVNGEWVPTYSDTFFYQGDGEPDYRAAAPPPAPVVWVEQALGGLKVRWNGQESETSTDIFSGINDFEGYHVYFARDNRDASFSLVSTYDINNYDKYVFNIRKQPEPGFELRDHPFTLDSLRCLYAPADDPCTDSVWDPLWYSAVAPYIHPDFPDSAFYFVKHEYNASSLTAAGGIRKVYPDAREPIPPLTDEDYTPDGYLKYYEYEYTINKLLPTVPYFVTVTAFDFGSPAAGLKPLETSRTLRAIEAYAAGSQNQLGEELPDVYIYPNPYRIDDDYIGKGYEGRNPRFFIPDRLRRIHFENLPPNCTIKIFSLDGDLIRKLDHNKAPSDPTVHHDTWDLISRNTQMIVSGIYIWTVEDHDSGRVQMGKLVVIL